jgi:hypothetical protein
MVRWARALLLILFLAPLPAQHTAAGPSTWQSCEGNHPRFSGQPAPISGIWYAYRQDGTEVSWEFWGQSFFRHTEISRNAWTSERGRFQITGSQLTLHITSESDARLGDIADSGTHCLDQMRRLSLTLLGHDGSDGLIIGGEHLRPMSR